MYVEILDGQYAGQMRDIEPGTALSLIALGRAKRAFGEPTPAVVATAPAIEPLMPCGTYEITSKGLAPAMAPAESKATVPAKQHPGHKKNR